MWPRDAVFANLSPDILNPELPNLSPVSIDWNVIKVVHMYEHTVTNWTAHYMYYLIMYMILRIPNFHGF